MAWKSTFAVGRVISRVIRESNEATKVVRARQTKQASETCRESTSKNVAFLQSVNKTQSGCLSGLFDPVVVPTTAMAGKPQAS